jgi:hypothetical protein
MDVYCVGGFGVMGWSPAADYESALPDPLADAAAGIMQHMNSDHKEELVMLARVLAGVKSQEAAITSIDSAFTFDSRPERACAAAASRSCGK